MRSSSQQSRQKQRKNKKVNKDRKNKSYYQSSSNSSLDSYQKRKKREHKRNKKQKNKSKSKSKSKLNKQRSRSRSNSANQMRKLNQMKKQTKMKYQIQKTKQKQIYQHKYQIHRINQQESNYYKNQYLNQANNRNKIVKQLPCFQPSGILLEYYNSREVILQYRGISLKFHEPPQSRAPIDEWRIYIFKGDQVLSKIFYYINLLNKYLDPILLKASSYLIGKDQRICDILAQNSSISRQHCVIQFRLKQTRTQTGEYLQKIKPYMMDLQSTNGTFVNDQRIESGRYYQLLNKDVLKFGFSQREYVIVKGDGRQDENVKNDD